MAMLPMKASHSKQHASICFNGHSNLQQIGFKVLPHQLYSTDFFLREYNLNGSMRKLWVGGNLDPMRRCNRAISGLDNSQHLSLNQALNRVPIREGPKLQYGLGSHTQDTSILHYITWSKVQILLNHYYTRCAELETENS